ncbi:MAG: alpha/beta fold hydrolase [Nannocystaceae bacterium]
MSAALERRVVGGHTWALRRWSSAGEGGAADEPTIVALHGFAGCGDDFAPLIAGGAAIGARWITVDVLGHGQSAAPADARDYAMPALAAGLAELLAASVRGPYVLLGYSMGGRLALSLLLGAGGAASTWPRPAALVLVGATPGIADADARAQRRAADEALADAIEARGLEWFADYWRERPILAGKRRIDPGRRAAMEARLLAQRPAGLAGALRGAGTGAMPPLWTRLGALGLPSLWLSGAEDPKFTAIAARAVALAPRARHVALADAGHTAHLEAPAAFLAALAAFTRERVEGVDATCDR